jgi:hypothetical protein
MLRCCQYDSPIFTRPEQEMYATGYYACGRAVIVEPGQLIPNIQAGISTLAEYIGNTVF